MKRSRAKQSKPRDFCAALIRSAYFPVELPPAFTTRYFAEFCRKNYVTLKSRQKQLANRTTNFETFTLPRLTFSRRNLALVHPLSQAAVSLLITDRRKQIKKLITESETSLYVTDELPAQSKAFAGLDFRKWEAKKARICSEYAFVLQADISRFFYTVYTHSIPWAVIGKAKVKTWLASGMKHRLDKHWSNGFDKVLQSCHSRETFGIPVGPDTSRIVAEMLLAGIEKDASFSSHVRGEAACRILDDFIIGFDSEEQARKALADLRSALWKFNLQLNEEKTSVLPSREMYRKKWEREQDESPFSAVGLTQAQEIGHILDTALELCAESKSDLPAIRACVKLAKLPNIGLEFPVTLDALFRLAREFPRCTSHVVGILINNQSLCQGLARERTVRWVRSTLKRHLPHGHDFEVGWCFVACAVLGIKIRKEDISHSVSMPSFAVLALLGLLREKKLLEFPLTFWPWRAQLKSLGIFSEAWLPYYESVRRKWTKDKAMIAVVNADPTLSEMLKEKVTFLEDDAFQAATINLKKRVFKKGAAKKPAALKWGWANIKIEDLDY